MLNRSPASLLAGVFAFLAAFPAAGDQRLPRYAAGFDDGSWIEGDQLVGWHSHTSSPALQGVSVCDDQRPLRWLRDRSLMPFSARGESQGFVEFVGGDRLPGRVVGFKTVGDGDEPPQLPHLLVEPGTQVHLSPGGARHPVRVLLANIRRIVWGRDGLPRLRPNTLYHVDGRELIFRGLRWKDAAVLLLTEDGTHAIPLADVAELHLPDRDPWEAYYDELAILSPDGDTRLVRFETTSGLIVTGSRTRFRATATGGPDEWRHMLQPCWSLDPIWVPFNTIHTRWSFPPHQVPLSRLHPVAAVQRSMLTEGWLWQWQTDRNTQGRLLNGGGREHGWGFGVHAYSELHFQLPDCVRSFRSLAALDRSAGGGGCVRVRVYGGSIKEDPLYESPWLVGSQALTDTGPISLHSPSGTQERLILQADPAHEGRPDGADPLDIRDMLDWLDPRLELDLAQLREHVRRRFGPLLAASPEWTVERDPQGVYRWTSHFHETGEPGEGSFLMMLQAEGRPLTLSREMTIGPEDQWLAVHLGLPSGENPRQNAVSLQAGDRRIQPHKLPTRQAWQNHPTPLLFPLDGYRDTKVTLQIKQPPGAEPVHWQAVSVLPSAYSPPAYRLADVMELAGKGNAQVTYELGQTLLSEKISNPEKLAAIEISQFGGIVNFRPRPTAELPLDTLANVVVDGSWTGGDKTFMTFKKMPSLKTLLLTEDCGISTGAVAELQAEMPNLTIDTFVKRIPSLERDSKFCPVTWRNLTDKKVIVLWIDMAGTLHVSRHLAPGERMDRDARINYSYEAHYEREDYASPADYTLSLPLTTFIVSPNALWEIKPRRK